METIQRSTRFTHAALPATVALAFASMIAAVFLTFCPNDARETFGILAVGVAGLTALVLTWIWLSPSAEGDSDKTPSPWPRGVEMPPMVQRSFARQLDSFNEVGRREAVQAFADSGMSPVAGIRCWPEQQCSDLQLAAAEAMLREWLEYLQQNPNAPAEAVLGELFPLEELAEEPDCIKPRVRRLAPPKEQPTPSRLASKLDEWSETIKEKVLDWDVVPSSNEHAESEGEDLLLAPLDRGQFAERMHRKLDEVMGYVAENLATAETDYELLAAERAIHPLLSTLRWEAIATALEMRQPDAGPVSIDELRDAAESLGPAENAPPNAKPTGDWVSKYRRMRAAGI